MTNAMGLILIRAGLSLLKNGHEKQADALAQKFVAQLNNPDIAVKMSKAERKYKLAFIKSHNLLDKVLGVLPNFEDIEKAIPK